MNVTTKSSEAQIDFIILTALEEERDAVLSKLPGFRKLDRVGEEPHTYYEAFVESRRQDQARYRVIVTSLARMGPLEAAAKAPAIVQRWQPRRVLMVGIAGGISGEVQLGDVLVASEIQDYTLGKVLEDGTRQIRWKSAPVDASLFDAAANFPKGWEDLVQAPRPVQGAPTRHIGLFASGGDVIASPDLIAEIKKTFPKLAGVEMEGGALGTVLHQTELRPGMLMIRGISDLADAVGNAATKQLWRSYACDVAAAYAISLLKEGPLAPSSIRLPQPSQEELRLRAGQLLDAAVPPSLVGYFRGAGASVKTVLEQLRSTPRYVVEENKDAKDARRLELLSLPSVREQHLVVGPGGSGKTTTSWGVTRALLKRGELAIYLPLAHFATTEEVLRHLEKSGLAPDVLRDQAATFILDGWSEFPLALSSKGAEDAERTKLLSLLGGMSIIAMGRYASQYDQRFTVWSLQPLSVQVIRKAVTQALGPGPPLSGSLEQLLRLPLALTLYLLLGGAENTTRGALLDRFHRHVADGVGVRSEFFPVLAAAAAETRLGRRSQRRTDFDAALDMAARAGGLEEPLQSVDRLATLGTRADIIEPVHDFYWEWLVGVGVLRDWPRFGLSAVESLDLRQALQLALEGGERLAAAHITAIAPMDLELAAIFLPTMSTLTREERQARQLVLNAITNGLASSNPAIRVSGMHAAFLSGDPEKFSAGLAQLTRFSAEGIYLLETSSVFTQCELWAHRVRLSAWLAENPGQAMDYILNAIRDSGQERWVAWLQKEVEEKRIPIDSAVESALGCTSSLPLWVRDALPELLRNGKGYRLRSAAARGTNVELAGWVADHYPEYVEPLTGLFVDLNRILVQLGDEALHDRLVTEFPAQHPQTQKLLVHAIEKMGPTQIARLQIKMLEGSTKPTTHTLFNMLSSEVPEDVARKWLCSPYEEVQLLGWKTLVARNPDGIVAELLANLPESFSKQHFIPPLEALLDVPVLPERVVGELLARFRGEMQPRATQMFLKVMVRTELGLVQLVNMISQSTSLFDAFFLSEIAGPLRNWQERSRFEIRVKRLDGMPLLDYLTIQAIESEKPSAFLGRLISKASSTRVLDAACAKWRAGDISIYQALQNAHELPQFHAGIVDQLFALPADAGIDDIINWFSKCLASFPGPVLMRLLDRIERHPNSQDLFNRFLYYLSNAPNQAHRSIHERVLGKILSAPVSAVHDYRNLATILVVHPPAIIKEMVGAKLDVDEGRRLWLIREVERVLRQRLLDEAGLPL